MVVGVGIDFVAVTRVRKELAHDGDSWKSRLFTPAEVAYCDGQRYPERHLAARFAAKEAVLKALGTGAADTGGFRDVEVRRGAGGTLSVALRGEASRAATALGAARVFLSLSHTADWAVAEAIVED